MERGRENPAPFCLQFTPQVNDFVYHLWSLLREADIIYLGQNNRRESVSA
jgi:hypothetical protein